MEIYLKARNSVFIAPENATYPLIVLQWDNWNDFSYSTLYVASIYRSNVTGDVVALGEMKIQWLHQTKADYTFPYGMVGGPIILDPTKEYCSLGVSPEYYEKIHQAGDIDFSANYLESICDAAFSAEVRSNFQDDDCFQISLLRESEARRLLDEAGRIFGRAQGLVNEFSATIDLPGSASSHNFFFDFSAHNGLPHRLQALVGLNGVGKTQVMARLAMLLSRFSKKNQREKTSTLETQGTLSPIPSIYNVVAISFSAFDEFERPTILQGEKFQYSYCGLRSQRGRLLSEDDLLENIRKIVMEELDDEKKKMLAENLDKIIKVDDIQSFVNNPENHRSLYDRLSAGQRIVLNALCHTLAKLKPRTLVLFDEPELHLHPQLLATMISALMDLLIKYDSFSIIATHSPIVIQQIPSRCVHIVRRDRMKPIVLKPSFESFGETLSEITKNVFLTTESDRDYRNIFDEILKNNENDIDKVDAIFDGKLSMNARIYLESRRRAIARD